MFSALKYAVVMKYENYVSSWQQGEPRGKLLSRQVAVEGAALCLVRRDHCVRAPCVCAFMDMYQFDCAPDCNNKIVCVRQPLVFLQPERTALAPSQSSSLPPRAPGGLFPRVTEPTWRTEPGLTGEAVWRRAAVIVCPRMCRCPERQSGLHTSVE